jgi:two-component system response regulator VicR
MPVRARSYRPNAYSYNYHLSTDLRHLSPCYADLVTRNFPCPIPCPAGSSQCRRLLGIVDGSPGPMWSVAFTHAKGTVVTADARQPHVLVINDTQEILDLIQDLLEDEGYRVTTSLALLDVAKVKTLAPDVIVQDLLFEGMQETGWKFLTLIRLDPELARIPVVLCTAAVRTVSDPEMAEQLNRQGIRVVLKPFTIEDLLTTLREIRIAQLLIDQATDGGER